MYGFSFSALTLFGGQWSCKNLNSAEDLLVGSFAGNSVNSGMTRTKYFLYSLFEISSCEIRSVIMLMADIIFI